MGVELAATGDSGSACLLTSVAAGVLAVWVARSVALG